MPRASPAGRAPTACSGRRGWRSTRPRLKVVRKMFALRFGEPAPERRSVDQLRGIEGARVRKLYELLAQQHGVSWRPARAMTRGDWDAGDIPNRCLSAATACLYGLAEAAVLAAGYAPGDRLPAHRQAALVRL